MKYQHRAARAVSRQRHLLPAVALLLALSACSSAADVDCDRLAAQKQQLLANSLSPSLRSRLATDAQRDQLAAACEEDPPSGAVALCQMEAQSIGQFIECSKRTESNE